jgi:hypothetical protein
MDRLSLFGLIAVTAMMVCYTLERRGRGYGVGARGRPPLVARTGAGGLTDQEMLICLVP